MCAVCPFPAGVQLKLRINQPARHKCPCRGCLGLLHNPSWVLCGIVWVSVCERKIPFDFEITCKGRVLRVWGKGQTPCREAVCTGCYIHVYKQIWHSEEQEGLIFLSETNCVFSRTSCLFLCRNRLNFKAVLFTLQKYVTETKIRYLLCIYVYNIKNK